MDNKTVLYIDDEEHNLLLFELIFAEQFEVITTLSTEEARDILKTRRVNVVISDLRMPEENGLEFISKVGPLYPNICFIILTAYLDVTSAMQAINQGHVYRYLLKPWDNNEIVQAINNALATNKLKTENEKLFSELKVKNYELERTLNDLQERESQFYNIFHSSIDGIIIFDKQNKILLANPAIRRVFRVNEGDMVNIHEFFDEKNFEKFKLRIIQLFENKKLTPFEYDITLSTGEKKVIEANSTLVKYAGQEVILSILRDITERKAMSQRILYEIVQAEDKERKRLASDLHDGLGPILSTLKMYIEWLSDKTRNGNSEQILELSFKTIQEAIVQLRAISHNLSPHILEKFGLIPAIQSQIDMIRATSPIQFSLESGLKERLPLHIETAIYRVLKECINNTIKYSKADNAVIKLELYEKALFVEYSDNGIGFNMDDIVKSGHGMGLYSIQNRLTSVNADMQMFSEEGKGFKLSFILDRDDIFVFPKE